MVSKKQANKSTHRISINLKKAAKKSNKHTGNRRSRRSIVIKSERDIIRESRVINEARRLEAVSIGKRVNGKGGVMAHHRGSERVGERRRRGARNGRRVGHVREASARSGARRQVPRCGHLLLQRSALRTRVEVSQHLVEFTRESCCVADR